MITLITTYFSSLDFLLRCCWICFISSREEIELVALRVLSLSV